MEKATLPQLFWSFCRIGGLTFGGGYAMLPILQRECAEKKKWLSKEKMLDFFSIAQCLPGIIACNTAALTGHYTRGWLGAFCAAAGVVTPSIVIILAIASFLQGFMGVAAVQHAFAGIQIGVVAVIAQAVVKLFKASVKSALGMALFLAAFALMSLPLVLPAGVLPFAVRTEFIILATAALGVGIGVAKARPGV